MGSFAAQAAILDQAFNWSGAVLSGSTALDLFAAGMADAPADAPARLAAFNAGFEHRTGYEFAATCPSSSHPATQTRWLQAGSCWSNLGSGIEMPVWPM